MNRRLRGPVGLLVGLVVVAVLAAAAAPSLLITGYETTTVEAVDAKSGEPLATVEARVADGPIKRYVGLSATEDLAPDEGMVFVHDEAGEYGYVMRDMGFGIDIVFADADGEITVIHEAKPESRPLTTYRGTGRYVLEVPLGWSAEHGVEPGDRLVIERS